MHQHITHEYQGDLFTSKFSMSSKNKFNNKCILLEPLWSFEVLNLWNLNPIQFCHIWYFQFNQPSFKSYIIPINILSLQNLNVFFCSDPAPDASIWGEIWRLPLVDYCPTQSLTNMEEDKSARWLPDWEKPHHWWQQAHKSSKRE